jgi:hypothetical protein
MDSDGTMDVVAASYYDNSVTVYFGSASATPLSFVASVRTTVAGPADVEVVDLDGDGDLDVVVASAVSNSAVWLTNNGGWPLPSFAQQVVGVGLRSCVRVVPSDIDNDGDLDIVAIAKGSDAVVWIENLSPVNRSRFRVELPPALNSSSLLPRRHAHPVVGDVVTLRLLHVDGGYRPLASSPCTINGIDAASSFAESSRGRYSLALSLSSTAQLDWPWTGLALDCTLSDFKGNVTRVTGRGVVGAALRWLGSGGGDGGVSTTPACSDSSSGSGGSGGGSSGGSSGCVNGSVLRSGVSAWLDVDGDGDVDVVGASELDDALRWYENNGANPPAFTPRNISAQLDALQYFDTADVNDDGVVDVVAASANDNRVTLHVNDAGRPTPSFVLVNVSTNLDNVLAASFGDVDGDGDMDVLASLLDGRVLWFENLSNRSRVALSPPRVVASRPASDLPGGSAVADVDRDGDADVAQVLVGGDTLVLYAGSGASPPTFAVGATFGASDGPRWRPVIADMDSDGTMDVVAASYYDNSVTIPPAFQAPAAQPEHTERHTSLTGATALASRSQQHQPSSASLVHNTAPSSTHAAKEQRSSTATHTADLAAVSVRPEGDGPHSGVGAAHEGDVSHLAPRAAALADELAHPHQLCAAVAVRLLEQRARVRDRRLERLRACDGVVHVAIRCADERHRELHHLGC